MDLPRCKICGERHRLGGCPDLDPVMNRLAEIQMLRPSDASVAREADPAKPRADSDESRPPVPIARDVIAVASQKFNKTAYQKEYMRRRRAEGKA